MDKLKPCPFCGGDAKVFHSSDCEEDEEYSIYCGKCYCSTEKVCTYGEAVKLWNSRNSHWHTGTPTENGWYLFSYKYLDTIRYGTDCFLGGKWAFNPVLDEKMLAWQKITPFEGEKNN